MAEGPKVPILTLNLSYNCCIRVCKQTIALAGTGKVGTHCLQRKVANSESQLLLPSLSFWSERGDPSAAGLRGKLAAFAGSGMFNVVHVHNEPDWLVSEARDAFGDGMPIVYDCHDLDSVRTGVANPDEMRAMALADAFIFPSRLYMERAVDYHRLRDDRPKMVIESRCLSGQFIRPEDALPRVGGVVYEGGLLVVDGPDSPAAKYIYRDYLAAASALADVGITFSVYGCANIHAGKYQAAGAIVHPPTPYQTMLRQLTRYDWGLVGCPVPHRQWQAALPNKLFEYMAAGIPVVCWNAEQSAEFIRQHGIGIVVNDIRELADRAGEWAACKRRVMEVREDFTMERQVDKIVGLYEGLTGKGAA